MRNIFQKLLGEIRPIHKIRCAIGLVASVSLFILSWYYLIDGLNKRFALVCGLCALIGLMIAFPMPFSKYLSIPVSILYLWYVPGKMFVRMEYPIHDFSMMAEGAELLNKLLIYLVFAVLLLVLQRVRYAFGVGSILLLIFSLVNFYVRSFRGSGLSFSDIGAAGTAMTVAWNYRLFMEPELWYSILWFLFFIVWGFWCRLPYRGKLYHLVVTGIALIYLGAFYLVVVKQDYVETHGMRANYWNMPMIQLQNGFLGGFYITVDDGAVERPDGYSEQRIQQILEEVQGVGGEAVSSEVSGEKPNIIMIMNEAWSDLRILGNLETTEEVMPFTESLTENVTRGNLHVGILGGLTANTEFEALTGDTLAFLSTTAIPYDAYFNHDIPSLATILEEQGYQTVAMHPSTHFAWNRDHVYDYMGFDEFIDANQFHVEYERSRGFITDDCDFREVIYLFEHRDVSKPFFLFNVTIQNHSDYTDVLEEYPVQITKIGDTVLGEDYYNHELDTYMNLMRMTDEAFETLVRYFESIEEPVIICMFGDHQPILRDDVYQMLYGRDASLDMQDNMQKYITPYLIWSNYDSDFAQYGDMSANYLGAVLLECAGRELPAYERFLLKLRRKYPVLSHMGCMDADGGLYTIEELLEEPDILNYRILQYSHLIDTKRRESVFSLP